MSENQLRLSLVLLGLAAVYPAFGAAPIDGVWKTEHGDQAEFYGCGQAMCIRLVTGKFKGQVLSKDLTVDDGGLYSGTLFNPADERTYSGSARLQDDGTLKLRGCAFKIFCKSQIWSRIR